MLPEGLTGALISFWQTTSHKLVQQWCCAGNCCSVIHFNYEHWSKFQLQVTTWELIRSRLILKKHIKKNFKKVIKCKDPSSQRVWLLVVEINDEQIVTWTHAGLNLHSIYWPEGGRLVQKSYSSGSCRITQKTNTPISTELVGGVKLRFKDILRFGGNRFNIRIKTLFFSCFPNYLLNHKLRMFVNDGSFYS